MFFECILMYDFGKSDETIAHENFDKANAMLKKIKKGAPATEETLKKLMEQYLTAFWVYKEYDHKIASDISTNIRSLGSIISSNFGCSLSYHKESEAYVTSCPVKLIDYNFGFSIRALTNYKCSICGRNILDCDHITGDYYDDVTCQKYNEICNICGKLGCNDHVIGEKYNHVKAIQIRYDSKIITFDLVQNPEMKYARITKIYFSKDDLKNLMPKDELNEFKFGKSVLYCNCCLKRR